MSRQTLAAFLLGLGLLLGLGCAARNSGGGGTAGAAPRGETPTDEEARQLAVTLENAFRSKQWDVIDSIFEASEFLRLVTGGLDASAQSRDPFCQGARKALQEKGSPLRIVLNRVPPWNDFRLLRIVTNEGEKRLRFRGLISDGGIAYIDLRVVRLPGGAVHVVDMYAFAAGEWSSETGHRDYMASLAERNKGIMARWTRTESDFDASLPQRIRMQDSLRKGDGKDALAAYASMPASVQETKTVMLLRLIASQSVDESQYLAAMNDFVREFPDDPALDLFGIDYAAMRKKHREMLHCLDRLDSAVGGDPYLGALRADAYVELKDYVKAKEEANRQIAALPQIDVGYWVLITVSLAEKNFDETNRVLGEMVAKCGLRSFAPEDHDLYAEYVKSPQYRRFRQEHPELAPLTE